MLGSAGSSAAVVACAELCPPYRGAPCGLCRCGTSHSCTRAMGSSIFVHHVRHLVRTFWKPVTPQARTSPQAALHTPPPPQVLLIATPAGPDLGCPRQIPQPPRLATLSCLYVM